VNDDRAGRTLDALYDQRAVIWGDLIANAAQHYALDLHRLHADTMAMTFAGLFAAQPAIEGVPRLEPGYNPIVAHLKARFQGHPAHAAWSSRSSHAGFRPASQARTAVS